MLVRRGDFLWVGSFEEDLQVGEFIGRFARARDCGLAKVMVEQVVLERRIHESNHTLKQRPFFGEYARMQKRTLDRRRSGSVS
jgi:hypothetical protein